MRRQVLSTAALSALCLPVATSFSSSDSCGTGSPNLQHIRLDRLLEVGSVTATDASSMLTPVPSLSESTDQDVVSIRKRENYDNGFKQEGPEKSTIRTREESTSLRNLSPVLQQITDERRKFQMNLGKAMDTLRKDMPYILKNQPDFSIYHPEITVTDPSGVQLTGLDSYKNGIKFVQQFVKFWFQSRSGLQYRMVYDFARSSIRVSWHAVLVPKMPLGKPLHVDGISMYKLDADSGKIIEHKFEKMMINNTPVIPPYGVFSLLQYEWGTTGPPAVGVPAGI